MAPASRTTKAAAGKKAASKKAAASTSAAAKTTKAPAPAVAARNGAATASAKKSAAKKAPAKKAPAAKATGAKAPVKNAPANKAPAKKSAAKKSAATKRATTKAPAAKKAGRKRSPFSAAFLAQQKKLLAEERATYVHQAESLQAEADALVADFVSGDAQFDEDGGEGDTLSSERERDLALSAQARAAIEEIDHALAKFDLGTYGICEASGDPIPEERLEAIPWARVQVQYKTGGIGRP